MTLNEPIDPDAFEQAMMNDDGLAARQHLVAGHAIYYADPCYPGSIVRKFPDGRMQLVAVSADGQITVIREVIDGKE